MAHMIRLYRSITSSLSPLRSVMLLAVRLYWGFQFAQTRWGKLHNVVKITGFFASLNIPFRAFSAPFVSPLEFVGGILLMLGFFRAPSHSCWRATCSLHTGPRTVKRS